MGVVNGHVNGLLSAFLPITGEGDQAYTNTSSTWGYVSTQPLSQVKQIESHAQAMVAGKQAPDVQGTLGLEAPDVKGVCKPSQVGRTYMQISMPLVTSGQDNVMLTP